VAEKDVRDEIEEESAMVLPRREAMSLIAPPVVSPIVKAEPIDPQPGIPPPIDEPVPFDTGQGIDERDMGESG
jgi:hypothetical protein